MRPEAWRLILDGEGDAAHNMAIDEAILEAHAAAGPRPPTLRIYGWSAPSYSLGRTQRPVEEGEIGRWLDAGLEVVRRPTGGDAVLHDDERTYAVVGTLGTPEFPRSVSGTYARIAEALAAGLRSLGIDALASGERDAAARRERAAVCFERLSGSEISVDGRKLVGSAQARRRGAFLQHGSIPIRLSGKRLAAAAGRAVDENAFTDVTRAARRDVTREEVDRALRRGFEEVFGARLDRSSLTAGEALRAAELRAWRYDSLAWTRDGVVGARERRWSGAAGGH